MLHGVSVKANALVHLVLNALCPWDLFFTFRLQQFQHRIQNLLPLWLDCLAEVEAASALATFAYLHPSYVWPIPGSAATLTASSRAYVRALTTGNGYGLVTTHDLELADLDQSIPGLTNSHFQETVSTGTLQFDYTLRPGPCPTTNALRIMELEGLPVPASGKKEGMEQSAPGKS